MKLYTSLCPEKGWEKATRENHSGAAAAHRTHTRSRRPQRDPHDVSHTSMRTSHLLHHA